MPGLESINLQHSTFFTVQLSHLYMTRGKTTALTMQAFVGKMMSLASFPRIKRLLISWLQSLSTVILEPKKIHHCFYVSPFNCHEVMGSDVMSLVFFNVEFYASFFLPLFTFISRLFSSSSLSAIRVVSSPYLRLLREHYRYISVKQHVTRRIQVVQYL